MDHVENRRLDVAVIGARGLVGSAIVAALDHSSIPVGALSLYGRTAAEAMNFRGRSVPIKAVDEHGILGADLIFHAGTRESSRLYCRELVSAGSLVIDTASALRMETDVPLIIPGVNNRDLTPASRLVAIPNCCAILLALALAPLIPLGLIEEVSVVCSQAVSGAGRLALEALDREVVTLGRSGEWPKEGWIGDVRSHSAQVDESGWNEEELKIRNEVPKILGLPELMVYPTCNRVAVRRGHRLDITVRFKDVISAAEAKACLLRAKSIELVDDPMPRSVGETSSVHVGRIRTAASRSRTLSLTVCGDQILRGAVVPAIQVAELTLSCTGPGFTPSQVLLSPLDS